VNGRVVLSSLPENVITECHVFAAGVDVGAGVGYGVGLGVAVLAMV
jgi:hypothetical protein